MKGRRIYVEKHDHLHHHYHRHVTIMELSLLLTIPSLTHPEISSLFFSGFFCFLVYFCIILGNLLRGIFFQMSYPISLYCCILSKTEVKFNSFVMSLFVLKSVQVCPAVFLIHFIFVAVILLVSVPSMV